MYMKIVMENGEDDVLEPYKTLSTTFTADLEYVDGAYFEGRYAGPRWVELLQDFITVLEKAYGYEIAHKVTIEPPKFRGFPDPSLPTTELTEDSLTEALATANAALNKKNKGQKAKDEYIDRIA